MVEEKAQAATQFKIQREEGGYKLCFLGSVFKKT